MRENASMPKQQAKLHAVMGGTPDEVEAAFYEALQRGDIDQLMACWADEDDIACIHPGGGRIRGAGAIRASFEAMFAHNGAIPVSPEQIQRVDSLASAVHHVLEKVEILTPEGPSSARVIATNVYHKTPQGWRMVVHHASPGTPEDTAHNPHAPQILH
jgi:ketosteroid isomerase-like protein